MKNTRVTLLWIVRIRRYCMILFYTYSTIFVHLQLYIWRPMCMCVVYVHDYVRIWWCMTWCGWSVGICVKWRPFWKLGYLMILPVLMDFRIQRKRWYLSFNVKCVFIQIGLFWFMCIFQFIALSPPHSKSAIEDQPGRLLPAAAPNGA